MASDLRRATPRDRSPFRARRPDSRRGSRTPCWKCIDHIRDRPVQIVSHRAEQAICTGGNPRLVVLYRLAVATDHSDMVTTAAPVARVRAPIDPLLLASMTAVFVIWGSTYLAA